MFSTNPLEIKTLTKDIHLCSFLDITLFVSVILRIKSLMLQNVSDVTLCF